MIYFIQQGKTGPIKIGYTKNDIKLRLKNLQISTPKKLYLLGAINGDTNKEKLLHKNFSDHRMKGEWFRYSTFIINEIKKILKSNEVKKIDESDIKINSYSLLQKYYILEKHHGNHSKVAKVLGMSARNYRNIRNEHHPPSQVIKNLIDEMIKAILNEKA